MNKSSDHFSQDLLDKVGGFPALTSAFLAQDYSARVGFDFSDLRVVFQKVREEYGGGI